MDDGRHAGSEKFFMECDRSQERLMSKDREKEHFKCAGVELETIPDGIRLRNHAYAVGIKSITLDCTFRQLRSSR